MIYSIVGTKKKDRENVLNKILENKKVDFIIYNDRLNELESKINQSDLFGQELVVAINQCLERGPNREFVYGLLSDMQNSRNIFIIDEPFGDGNCFKKLDKFSEKVFDFRESKDEEVNPFPLCEAFTSRDKKQTFIEWNLIKEKVDNFESVQGVLWWKIKNIWGDNLKGKNTKFTKEECEFFGGEIVKASILAHRGELDLKNKLEEILLSI